MTVGGDSGGPPPAALDLDVKASDDTPEDHDGAPPSTFDGVDDAALALHSRHRRSRHKIPEATRLATFLTSIEMDWSSMWDQTKRTCIIHREDAARFTQRLTLTFRPSEVLATAATGPYADYVESATLAASPASTSPSLDHVALFYLAVRWSLGFLPGF